MKGSIIWKKWTVITLSPGQDTDEVCANHASINVSVTHCSFWNICKICCVLSFPLAVGWAWTEDGWTDSPSNCFYSSLATRTCVAHVLWCISGPLWVSHAPGMLGTFSPHSRRMRNPQFCVFGKRPIYEAPGQSGANSLDFRLKSI